MVESKESEIVKGLCIINTWEQFRNEFKKAFFPHNAIYEAKRKLRELKQMSSMSICKRIYYLHVPDS